MNTCLNCYYFHYRGTRQNELGAEVKVGTCHFKVPKAIMQIIPVQGLDGPKPQQLTATFRPQVSADDVGCRSYSPMKPERS